MAVNLSFHLSKATNVKRSGAPQATSTKLSSQSSVYFAALINDQGEEVPITEDMIQRSLKALEGLNTPWGADR